MNFYNIDKRQEARDNLDEQNESLQAQMARLQKQIHYEHYYENLYTQSLGFLAMTEKGVELGTYDEEEIIELANCFWDALPDAAVIRRAPFFLLCDIAEHCFDEDK